MSDEPKKRGRKKNVPIQEPVVPIEHVLPKKRGRKPKGGKIIEEAGKESSNEEVISNVILHLKCSTQEIDNETCDDTILSHNILSSKINELSYHVITKDEYNDASTISSHTENTHQVIQNTHHDFDDSDKATMKQIHIKLKELQYNLHTNNICDKKSACFWCTCEFSNPPIYIPKYQRNDKYDVYGCFCSPECSVAHLMNENIDSSSKFERYQLLNNIYSKIYNYTKNIKPAPNPHYTLDKFYGNLSITEYRKLLQHDRLLFIVDKPLTRILPELHEDNDDLFLLNNNTNTTTLKIKKKTHQFSKNDVVSEKFGHQSNM